MKPWATCLIGMMVGSLVLIWAAVFKPHDLQDMLDHSEKNVFLFKKGLTSRNSLLSF